MNKRHLKLLYFLILAVLLFSTDSTAKANAKSMTDLRIGLKELYSNTKSITIYNTKVSFGYSVNDSFRVEKKLSGSNGFTFSVASGFFAASKETYSSFDKADSYAGALRKKGIEAAPVCIYSHCYRVYIFSDTKELVAEYAAKSDDSSKWTEVNPMSDYVVRVSYGKSFFFMDASEKKAYPQFKASLKNSAGVYTLNLGSRQYRGRLEIGSYGKGGVTAVSIINIEAYLASVLPCEMVSTWHVEALKAQAVVARSYAEAKSPFGSDTDLNNPYDLVDTTASQVYKGYSYETNMTTKAVLATKGELVTYKGKTVNAYFFSTSGGSTENGSDLWGSNEPYLLGTSDIYELIPEKAPWLVRTNLKSIGKLLSEAGYNIGTPRRLSQEVLSSSGRTLVLRIYGKDSNTALQYEKVRTVLNLLSTKFKIVQYGERKDAAFAVGSSEKAEIRLSDAYVLSSSGTKKLSDTTLDQYIAMSSDNMTNYPALSPSEKDDVYIFGMGYGHGVGMSQSGALGMAEAGFDYHAIIEHYFTGTTCIKK